MDMIEINEAFSVVALANIKVFTSLFLPELLILLIFIYSQVSAMNVA